MNKTNIKYLHISFDDICTCLHDLTINKYTSIFENEFLNTLRTLNNQFGAVFTLNCFNTFSKNPDYNITKLPASYAEEFEANSNWLRFSFHAEDDLTNYGTGLDGTSKFGQPTGDCPDAIIASYKCFTDAILHATNTPRCIDQYPRLGFFSCTKNNMLALKKCDYAPLGLLSADDTRISYYLTSEQNQALLTNGILPDNECSITMLKSQVRLEKVTDSKSEFQKILATPCNIIELFTHEQNFTPATQQCLIDYLGYAKESGLQFGFAQDVL